MKYNPDLHHRHSIRLQNYDYANIGAYFVTVCCQNRINHFGEIVNNANNVVGAGSACPIVKPCMQMRTNLQQGHDLHIAKPNLQMRTNLQQGQADPAYGYG